MGKRKRIPQEVETEVLVRSRRRCCICYGLKQDLKEKRGQIAHLDQDPSNPDFDNLTYLCLDHHDQYDSRTSQSKGLTEREVKEYRHRLYEKVAQMDRASWPGGIAVPLLEIPLLDFLRPVELKEGFPIRGIQLTDRDLEKSDKTPLLYVSIYFKKSRYFGRHFIDDGEKWLYIIANMRPALSLRVQVRAWNQRDEYEFMEVLRNGGRGYDLHGPRSALDSAGDYLLVEQKDDEHRAIISTFTATSAGIAIHARFSQKVAQGLADYLEGAGLAPNYAEWRAAFPQL
jgi:hypothetical protein